MRRLISLIVTLAMLLPVLLHVSAASTPLIDPETGLTVDLARYSDAYIELTERLNADGITPMLCIEDFVYIFQTGNYRSI